MLVVLVEIIFNYIIFFRRSGAEVVDTATAWKAPFIAKVYRIILVDISYMYI